MTRNNKILRSFLPAFCAVALLTVSTSYADSANSDKTSSGINANSVNSASDESHGHVIHLYWKKEEIYDHNRQTVTLTGGARAVRDDITLDADMLIGYLRPKNVGNTANDTSNNEGGMELYRVEARGHVNIYSGHDHAQGDHGLYDVDKAVILLTGKAMKITTQHEIITARDLMEYYPRTRTSIGRGDTSVTTDDGKRITSDILEAVGLSNSQQEANRKSSSSSRQGTASLDRAYGWGHVVIRTRTQTATGDRGVYLFGPQLARLVGHVRITQGQNQNNGSQAIVNMKTGIATMLPDGQSPVQGLIVPSEAK